MTDGRRGALAASAFALCSGALLVGAVIHAAWSSDDAFITLRSVDNWVNGYGLRWNVAERVQSYTHPAWMFIVAAVYALWRSPAVALLAPSIALTVVFVAALIVSFPDRKTSGALCLALLATKSFVEFSTSGLENALIHVALLCYSVLVLHVIVQQRGLWMVTTQAALLLLIRFDLAWLIGPSLLAAAWRARPELSRAQTWYGVAPLLTWELFAIVYYGFPLPNTAYAKLDGTIPIEEAVEQGLRYVGAHVRYDPITISVIAVGIACGLVSRRRELLPLALGSLAWLLYLVRIGGDFMLGRLMTPALVVAAVMISEGLSSKLRALLPVATAGLVSVAFFLPRTALRGAPRQAEDGWLPEMVTDERAIYFANTGLFRPSNPEGPRTHPYTTAVLDQVAQGKRLLSAGSIGFAGFYSGPAVHIVDEFGLADPFLARLPADHAWSPGHLFRRLPEGYLATLESGHNELTEPTLASRYAELTEIVRGPVWRTSRFAAIARWNLGWKSIAPFDYQVRRIPLSDVRGAPGDGASTREAGVTTLDRQGLAVALEFPALVRKVSVAVGADDRYRVALRSGKRVLWETRIDPVGPDRQRLRSHLLAPETPLSIDSILFQGRRGDHRYHVGSVTLEPAPPD